jgi:hypothetical protein
MNRLRDSGLLVYYSHGTRRENQDRERASKYLCYIGIDSYKSKLHTGYDLYRSMLNIAS